MDGGAGVAGVAGCASNEVRVRTAIAPDANLNSEKTFRFLPMTMTHPVSDVVQQADPMFENSISGVRSATTSRAKWRSAATHACAIRKRI